ncbi:MAG: hypothetical protein NC123_18530 [Butyrivibrio sp.]|nr:hypothetical protein [Butyrivibrio sp.]
MTRRTSRYKKKRTGALDKYVIFSITILLIYTAAQTIVTLKTGTESTTLTTCFFSVFGGEILMCALIKKWKLKDVKTEREEG